MSEKPESYPTYWRTWKWHDWLAVCGVPIAAIGLIFGIIWADWRGIFCPIGFTMISIAGYAGRREERADAKP